MKLSIVIPIFREIKYIEKVWDFLVHANPADKEVFLIDGGSDDGTIEYLQEKIKNQPGYFLLQNPDKTVPYALNIAIPKCTGDIVVRMDAHTVYAEDYFEKIIEVISSCDADIVGGPMRIAQGTTFQKAVGVATSSAFGVGNSDFHFEEFKGYTDSVYLGAWKRSLFDKTGLFNTFFKRNQDDEFHYRARKLGFKIFQHPDIKLYYFPRASAKTLFKQYYQYGVYKPAVLKENSNGFRLRHIIPSLFVCYIMLLPFMFFFISFYAFIPLLLYIFAALYFAAPLKYGPGLSARIFLIYFILHISYGLGFLVGLNKKAK